MAHAGLMKESKNRQAELTAVTLKFSAQMCNVSCALKVQVTTSHRALHSDRRHRVSYTKLAEMQKQNTGSEGGGGNTSPTSQTLFEYFCFRATLNCMCQNNTEREKIKRLKTRQKFNFVSHIEVQVGPWSRQHPTLSRTKYFSALFFSSV